MSFKLPRYLESYLSTVHSAPFQSYVNTSQFYANLDAYYITYMDRVVRQCMAYAYASQDGAYNSALSANVGYSIIKTATKLIKGDKIFFNGDDEACKFLSDIWVKFAGFDYFIEQAINYTLAGGTCAIKLNKDALGRCKMVANRVDRFVCSTNDNGEVTDALFFISLLSSEKSIGNVNEQYWLVEHRYYKKNKPCVEYKVHRKSGVAGNEVLPFSYSGGIPMEELTEQAQMNLKRQGIKVNKALPLPFRDGLGVWIMTCTAVNSCVPGAKMGDPLLYGSLELLWSLDTVFSGSLIDVLNGKGQILLPKMFLKSINEQLRKAGVNEPYLLTSEVYDEDDDNITWVYTEANKDFKPEAVQFEIRSQEYREMFEMYLRQVVVTTGFAPSTLFPFLQDNTQKTATEVRAEDNLTRASVLEFHRLNNPELNKAIAEILYQSGFNGEATIELSDYIGNKLQHDNNTRENFREGLTPKEVAVQRVNSLSVGETAEYMEKLRKDAEEQEAVFRRGELGAAPFNEANYYEEGGAM